MATRRETDAVVVALPWRACARRFRHELLAALPALAGVEQIEAAPITGVHLWFDRETIPLHHAVLVGRLSQWVFNRGRRTTVIKGRAGTLLSSGHQCLTVVGRPRARRRRAGSRK